MLAERYEISGSEGLINELRVDGIKLLGNGNSYAVFDIPPDIVSRTERFCNQNIGIRTMSYDIIDPETKETAILKIWDCGYAEVIE